MASSAPNLFLRLHKWAARQDENFVTESLAFVLEHLLALAPEVGTRLVRRLTGGFIAPSPEDAGVIQIRTQVEVGVGRPDLQISIPHHLVWIEVKVESSLRAGQLEGYRVLLAEQGEANTRLVLLSRYAEEFGTQAARPDLAVRWFEFADWLENELPAIEAASETAGFVTRQFLDFLGARGMTLTQVGKFMPEGLRAWGSLNLMLYEAAAACKVSAKIYADREFIGLYLDGRKYLVGVEYANPELLWFATLTRINQEAASKLGVGELMEEKRAPGHKQWCLSAELESEPIHFFARSKVGQMEWLEGFLRECLAQARSIETPDQPPIRDESEGD